MLIQFGCNIGCKSDIYIFCKRNQTKHLDLLFAGCERGALPAELVAHGTDHASDRRGRRNLQKRHTAGVSIVANAEFPANGPRLHRAAMGSQGQPKWSAENFCRWTGADESGTEGMLGCIPRGSEKVVRQSDSKKKRATRFEAAWPSFLRDPIYAIPTLPDARNSLDIYCQRHYRNPAGRKHSFYGGKT